MKDTQLSQAGRNVAMHRFGAGGGVLMRDGQRVGSRMGARRLRLEPVDLRARGRTAGVEDQHLAVLRPHLQEARRQVAGHLPRDQFRFPLGILTKKSLLDGRTGVIAISDKVRKPIFR